MQANHLSLYVRGALYPKKNTGVCVRVCVCTGICVCLSSLYAFFFLLRTDARTTTLSFPFISLERILPLILFSTSTNLLKVNKKGCLPPRALRFDEVTIGTHCHDSLQSHQTIACILASLSCSLKTIDQHVGHVFATCDEGISPIYC